MKPTELLAQFRVLGGVAENVCLRQGEHGLGLFAIDPKTPVRVSTPAQLLISPEWLSLTHDGQLKVKATNGLPPALAAFHEAYQKSVGWGAGGFERIRHHHQQMRTLPAVLQNFLRLMGGPELVHHAPTPAEAFQAHCISRQISVNGVSKLMPVLELINHAPDGSPYVVDDGVSLSGTFKDEVFACYRRRMDAFHFFFNYHFPCPGRSALSCCVSIDLPKIGTLHIGRHDGLAESRNGILMPKLHARKGNIHLPYLELANLDEPALPRAVFAALMAEHGLPPADIHQLFDGLIAHNLHVLNDFMKACERADGPLVQQLRAVAGSQISCLNAASPGGNSRL